ncbi:hypothetical protein [Clostridium sp. Cult3]|jgi:hypothetical protein|uniref:hypothetical protein n=1 Tax=Clostridium sp. Cult3 TaxID=2079004 RepID=UPI001F2E7B3B|nr:hypothetical protein [Clostridium sp. Cult3]MCF6459578.1 hypothetical protein [Clostridium sp. Cult3]
MNLNYPELYYRIYPKVIDTVNRHLEDKESMEDITDKDMEKMVDEVYQKMAMECQEIDDDPAERRSRSSRYRAMQRPFYGRRRLVRDIISIILLSELLRRTNPYSYGPGYHAPWY